MSSGEFLHWIIAGAQVSVPLNSQPLLHYTRKVGSLPKKLNLVGLRVLVRSMDMLLLVWILVLLGHHSKENTKFYYAEYFAIALICRLHRIYSIFSIIYFDLKCLNEVTNVNRDLINNSLDN